MDIHMTSAPQDRHRSRGLFLRLRDDERAELEAIAEHRRLSLTDTIRQLLREEAERLGSKQKRARRRTK